MIVSAREAAFISLECRQWMRCLWLCVSGVLSTQQQRESEERSMNVLLLGQQWLTDLLEIGLKLKS